jgi:ribonuclease D
LNDVVLSRTSLRAVELPVYQGLAMADVRLIDSEALAGEAYEALMAAEIIGFDTESKPTFRVGEVSTGPHLVQLATAARAYLFQMSRPHGSHQLKQLLQAPRLLKVGFGLGNDRSILSTRLNIEIANVLDMGEILRGPGHRGTVGAKVAVAHFFGCKLHKSKKTSTSNWAAPHLTERQMLYAANDAHVALSVYMAWLRSGSGAPGEAA